MKKAADILLIISGIISIVWAVGYLIAAIVFFILSSPQFGQYIIDGLNNGSIHSTIPGTPEQQVAAIQLAFLIVGIVMAIALAFSIACAVFSFIGRNKRSTVSYVLIIMFSVLSGTIVGLVGSIFGLVSKDEQ